MTEETPLARLYRPKPSSYFFSPTIVATLDKKNNIVFINTDLFESLAPHQKNRVYNLQDDYLEVAPAEFTFS
jgi:hypothetical protein